MDTVTDNPSFTMNTPETSLEASLEAISASPVDPELEVKPEVTATSNTTEKEAPEPRPAVIPTESQEGRPAFLQKLNSKSMFWLLVLLLPLLLLLFLLPPALSRQPNILYIMSDDLGFEDLGFQGSDILTPNIDKLARSGVILENHYVMPVCAPSRASFMTGKHAARTGFWYGNMSPYADWGLRTEDTTIPQMLKKYGYSNHLVGKWHLGMSHWSMTPVMRGFDTFLGQYHGAGNYFTHQIQSAYDFRENYVTNGVFKDEIRLDLDGVYSTYVYTNRTISLIKGYSNNPDPWFIFLSYTAPHKQYMAPEEAIKKYSSHMIYSSEDRKKYATMISLLDEGVGQIVDSLKKADTFDNTLIVFTSDNGAFLEGAGSNYPLKGGKTTFYEGGVRGVSFVHSPLLEKTGYINRNIHHIVDWYPTFEYLAQSSKDTAEKTANINGVNQWSSVCKGETARNGVLINLMVKHKKDPYEVDLGPTTVNITDHDSFILNGSVIHLVDVDDHLATNNIEATAVENSISPFLEENSMFAYRWYSWKLILGEVGNETRLSSKSLESPRRDDTSNKTYVRLFQHDIVKRVQLYNLHQDPGEWHNVAEINPGVVSIIAKKLLRYVRTMTWLDRTYCYDDRGKTNGVWTPWLDSDGI